MLPNLRSALRAVARALRRSPALPAGVLERWRVELLLNAVAAQLREWRGEEMPPSFAMLEVLVREMPEEELAAAIHQLDGDDGERVMALLARMRGRAEGVGTVAAAEPEKAPEQIDEEDVHVPREVAGDEAALVRRARLDSMLLTGDSRSERVLLDGVASGTYDGDTALWIARTIIDGSVDDDNRKRALSLVRLDPFSKARAVRTLAEIVAWGTERGLELTAKAFRFRLYGTAEGEVGQTRLGGRVIHFNPLPLLRGESDGRRIVEAILLHEIGHHRYNSGPEWRPVDRAASKEGLDRLMNLIMDEHLERNLRSIEREWGDSLKILGAWAFQRSSRTIAIDTLLTLAGPGAFRVLSRAQLEPARERGQVTVNSGRLLRALAMNGSSFSRFMRALRMGLGNRSGDPKVSEALALFDKDFRGATPMRMLEIARELRRIFGDETGIAAQISLHGAMEADSSEIASRLPGISDADIAGELEKIRRTPRPPSSRKNDNVAQTIDRSESTEFDTIDEIVVLPFHAHEYWELAKGVAGWSRQLRRFLETLGLSRVTLRRRTRGSAVDRGALPRAVVGGDPRLLMARRTVPKSDLFLGVLIDCSGSMVREGSMERAHLFGALIAEAARGLDGVEARFFGFTDEVIFDAGNAARCAVAQLAPNGGNNDAAALWFASRVALKSKRSARLLVMISDGSPTDCSVESLRALVKRLTAERIACAQVAVQPIDDVCFPDYVLVDDKNLSDAVGRFGKIIARLVRKVMR